MLSRIGGDEFTILMQIPADLSPRDALEPLTQAFSTPFILSGDQVWLTCSMGVSLNPQDATSPEDMMRNADIAMYQAKGRGRSQIQVFSQNFGIRSIVKRKSLKLCARHSRKTAFTWCSSPDTHWLLEAIWSVRKFFSELETRS